MLTVTDGGGGGGVTLDEELPPHATKNERLRKIATERRIFWWSGFNNGHHRVRVTWTLTQRVKNSSVLPRNDDPCAESI